MLPRDRFSLQLPERGRAGLCPAAARLRHRRGALQRPRLVWPGSRPVAVASPVFYTGPDAHRRLPVCVV
eukprot:5587605-Heterocapsa_arctica.AAC.1